MKSFNVKFKNWLRFKVYNSLIQNIHFRFTSDEEGSRLLKFFPSPVDTNLDSRLDFHQSNGLKLPYSKIHSSYRKPTNK